MIAVVRFPGSLDHDSAVRAVEAAGGTATYAWHADHALPAGTRAIVLPGGFSYGDHLRPGAIASRSPIMGAVRRHAEGHDNVIATGGGPGIMEAANRGAHDVGAPTIGFNITLSHEQRPNPYTTPELTFRFHYFAMRKMHLAMGARALVVFPGGFGTFDEAFELLNLVQTGKAKPVPIVFVDEDYWRGVVNFDALVDSGVVNRADIDLITFVKDGRSAWAALKGKLEIRGNSSGQTLGAATKSG